MKYFYIQILVYTTHTKCPNFKVLVMTAFMSHQKISIFPYSALCPTLQVALHVTMKLCCQQYSADQCSAAQRSVKYITVHFSEVLKNYIVTKGNIIMGTAFQYIFFPSRAVQGQSFSSGCQKWLSRVYHLELCKQCLFT